ncbi:MAG: PEP-CTERM sorting domain-containing protein [Planctomycetes bacterium]|nr:PEP-CTERM sorting domain-containing protein [Planctomycetota bacterium]
MEGWKSWKRCVVATTIAVGTIACAGNDLHAAPSQSAGAEGKAIVAALQAEWEAVREDMLQAVLEEMSTMILGYWGNPPPPPTTQEQPPPPPPPTGGGETPPNDPPIDPPPPQGTPEPASLVTALLGVGLASVYAWRRRRNRLPG